MDFRLMFFLLNICLLISCSDKSTNSTQKNVAEEKSELLGETPDSLAEPADEVMEIEGDPAEEPAIQARSAAINDGFPKDQRVEFTSEMLNGLCTSKYSCLEETIYPIGWSADGKFAYLLEEANEAVVNYTLHLIVQDTKTDKQLLKDTYKASEQPNSKSEDTSIDFSIVWEENKDKYNELLLEHKISGGNGTQFYGIPWVTSQRPYRLKALNKMTHNDLFDVDVVAEHRLEISEQGVGKKVILSHTFGKYDMALATQALGYFESPFENRIAVINAYEKRGYEGPPNVLKLMIVGCDLSQGFK